jgi:hypothetical protein
MTGFPPEVRGRSRDFAREVCLCAFAQMKIRGEAIQMRVDLDDEYSPGLVVLTDRRLLCLTRTSAGVQVEEISLNADPEFYWAGYFSRTLKVFTSKNEELAARVDRADPNFERFIAAFSSHATQVDAPRTWVSDEIFE